MKQGYWMLVLHAHLPFVRHPEYNDVIEERWLYEAITETYVPLLWVFEQLASENIPFRVTMSITPPLANMLTDELLQNRYISHIEKLIQLAEQEVVRNRFVPEYHKLAEFYLDRFQRIRKTFVETYKKDLVKAFRRFQDLGYLEILTSGATHGFFPLLSVHPEAVRAQIQVAVRDYARHFGRAPKGIWNPECGYYPGLEHLLKEAGIRFFYTDTHGILHASEKPLYGVFAPMQTPNGVSYFARDVDTSHSVWSSAEGYPGDGAYREFYRDIGFDLEHNYIKPYIHESGLRIATGIKYHRITSKETPMDHKLPYDITMAQEKVKEHAHHFVYSREQQINYVASLMDRPPVVVSMYDAELFGHWWFEGPDFLYHVIKQMATHPKMGMITAPEYLEMFPNNQVATPPLCSWGYKGYCEFWLNGTNDWIYPHLHKMAERMRELANTYRGNQNPVVIRALNQAARELLLAQSSDWAFIMRTGTMVDYAVKRTKLHISRFNQLYEMIHLKVEIDEAWLTEVEKRDNIFPEIDFRVYCS
jgi:1,4-alpha-glucan branching enzyme